jgi:hypothetical protein
MRPIRPSLETYDIAARACYRACGKTRELSGEELIGAASIDAFKELEARLRCTDCGERAVRVEPIFHPDWR